MYTRYSVHGIEERNYPKTSNRHTQRDFAHGNRAEPESGKYHEDLPVLKRKIK
jgi:hypothetical protein